MSGSYSLDGAILFCRTTLIKVVD